MAAQIINGEAVAAEVTAALKKDVEALKAKGVAPKLTAVIATDNKGARIYASNQAKTCEKIGVAYQLCELPPASTRGGDHRGDSKIERGSLRQRDHHPDAAAGGRQRAAAPGDDRRVEGRARA